MPRQREKGPWFWRGMIATMLASVFGLFAVAAFSAPPAVVAETNCRIDRKDPAHTIVLIDQSDPFGENDIAWVHDLIDAEARALPRNGRLTVVMPNATVPHAPKQLHSACSTGSPDRANPILSNPQMVADTWRELFYLPLEASVEAALKDTRQPASPLMEALYAVADRPDFKAAQQGRRLILVSDLMQHSDGFSFYRMGADLVAFEETRLAGEVPSFAGVDVVARIVPRQEYDLPMTEVRAFWSIWFSQAGAEFGAVS